MWGCPGNPQEWKWGSAPWFNLPPSHGCLNPSPCGGATEGGPAGRLALKATITPPDLPPLRDLPLSGSSPGRTRRLRLRVKQDQVRAQRRTRGLSRPGCLPPGCAPRAGQTGDLPLAGGRARAPSPGSIRGPERRRARFGHGGRRRGRWPERLRRAMNSFLEYLARGGEGLSLSGKLGCGGGEALRPPCPLSGAGESAYLGSPPDSAAQQQQPPPPPQLEPCALARFASPQYGALLRPEAARGGQRQAGGAPAHYATAVFSGGGGGAAYLPVDYSALAETLQPCAKALPPPPPSSSDCRPARAALSTFEWMRIKRSAPPRSKPGGSGAGARPVKPFWAHRRLGWMRKEGARFRMALAGAWRG